MPWTVRVTDPSGDLDDLVEPIRATIENARRRAETVVAPVDLTLMVQSGRAGVIAHLGHGGYAPTGRMMCLTFDASRPTCAEHLGEPLERTIAHELHHILRWRGPGYGRTLGEALVTEGLAGHFVQQIYGGPPARWEAALDQRQLRTAAREANTVWDDANYDHAPWFFGAGPWPPWTGYTLGYALIGRHLATDGTETPAALSRTPAKAFRQALSDLAT